MIDRNDMNDTKVEVPRDPSPITYKSHPVTLKTCKINPKDDKVDRYIFTETTDLHPHTIVSNAFCRDLRPADVPRTKVVYKKPDHTSREVYEICTFTAKDIPPLSECTLLFEYHPPSPSPAVPVTAIPPATGTDGGTTVPASASVASPTFQNLPIKLHSTKINPKDERFDRYIFTENVALKPETKCVASFTRVTRASERPRTKVIWMDPNTKEIYDICTFVGLEIPLLDQCDLLFEPPLPKCTLVTDISGLTVTNQISLLHDVDVFKFGTAYYKLQQSVLERMIRLRKRFTGDPLKNIHIDPSALHTVEDLQHQVGKDGVNIVMGVLDLFFLENSAQVETALSLLQQVDVDDIVPHRPQLAALLDKTNKRMRMMT